MVQYNGFPNRLLELVRIFTVKLMMARWRRLCIGSVGAGMIERVIHGNRSHICRDILAWWKRSRNHIKKMLRDWLLTVGVRQNQKRHMLSKTLPNILSCAWKVLPHQCGLWACFRWWVGIPAIAWNEPTRHGLWYYSSAYSMHSVRMWICGQISEHFQSGESLCHSWNLSQRTCLGESSPDESLTISSTG